MLCDMETLSPQEISIEVRKFISGAVRSSHSSNTQDVTRTALSLLKNLPAARDAVLEYFCNVFFIAVTKYVRQIEVFTQENTHIIHSFFFVTYDIFINYTFFTDESKCNNKRREHYNGDSYCSEQFYKWKSRIMGTHHLNMVFGITW